MGKFWGKGGSMQYASSAWADGCPWFLVGTGPVWKLQWNGLNGWTPSPVFLLESNKRTYTYILTYNFLRSPLLTAHTAKHLDVVDIFCGCKNIRLGINVTPARHLTRLRMPGPVLRPSPSLARKRISHLPLWAKAKRMMSLIGMLIPVFGQTGFRLFKTGFRFYWPS